MNSPIVENTSRRDFLKTATKATAGLSVLSGISIPYVHAAGSDEIRAALIGCGGRGTGAASNAMTVKQRMPRLVAMADVMKDRLDASFENLTKKHPDRMSVSEDAKFIGFDAYKNAIDTLRKGDVAIFTTPVAFRWVHYKYAIEKGVNVFMEKPICTDGPTARRLLALNEEAKKKNLKVGVGLMCRHCRVRGELFNRIQDGEIGDLLLMRAYRMQGIIGSVFTPRRDPKSHPNELLWQIKNFHSFLWASGGGFSDFNIHNIDEACWMKNDWPVEVQASGGRSDRGDNVDQNFDHYSCEYTFKDGAKLFLEGRTALNVHTQFATQVHGTKGCAIVSTAGHFPSKAMSFKGQDFTNRANLLWRGKQPEPNPYDLEWEDLVKAISDDTEYNEVERGIKSSVTTAMGRWAAHTGQKITYEEYINSPFEFSPDVDKLTLESAPPLVADKDGNYPFPKAGQFKDREYAMEPQANPFPLIKFGA
ncbi:MAG: Gfo/Idh/MocA family oxidoreductase [Verrucomicrobiaceae bacterium]|nr:Gfo/Idh/MocA family oxidoreductase [Verrucomicrobiaceae bacterium]